jgi:hypothetical protein
MNMTPRARENATIVNASTWVHAQVMDFLPAVWNATKHSSTMPATSNI